MWPRDGKGANAVGNGADRPARGAALQARENAVSCEAQGNKPRLYHVGGDKEWEKVMFLLMEQFLTAHLFLFLNKKLAFSFCTGPRKLYSQPVTQFLST